MIAKAAQIQLLGPPAVLHAGKRLHVSRRKSLALIAYLALHDNRMPRDSLAALLWPEFAHEQARRALRTTLAHVRELLPGGVVGSDREQVWFSTRMIDVDAVRYLDLCRSIGATSSTTTELPPDGIALVEETVGLYRGEFLSGFFLSGCSSFDTWQMTTADRFSQMQTELLWILVRHRVDMGDTQDAMRLIGRIIEMDPGNEEAHRELMLLFFESGDRSSAIRQYERCVHVLEAELGNAPDECTQELYRTIRYAPLESPRRARLPPTSAEEQQGEHDSGRQPAANSLVGEVRVVSLLVARVNAPGCEFDTDSGSTEEDATGRPVDELSETLIAAALEESAAWDGCTVHAEGCQVVAAFGLQRTHEDDPERAVLSAIRIRDQLAAGGHRAAFAVRTGVMMVAMGFEQVVGPLVRQARRQLAITKDGAISVCGRTHRRVSRCAQCSVELERPGGDDRLGQVYGVISWLDVASPLSDAGVPFVGRASELEKLAACLTESDAAGAIVCGPAGIGKSRLVVECQKELARRGVESNWLAMLCSERQQGTAFGSMIPFLGTLLDLLVDPNDAGNPVTAVCRLLTESGAIKEKQGGESRTVLSSLLQGTRRVEAIGATALVTREEFQRVVEATFRGLLTLLKERSPLILNLEDLHWADEATVGLIADVLPVVAGPDLWFVFTCRPAEDARQQCVLERMRGLGCGATLMLELEPLGEEALRAIVSNSRTEPTDDEAEMAIVSRAGGNPFYALELAREGAEGTSTEVDLPRMLDVKRVIQRRIEHLGPETRSLLRTAAVAGGDVDWAVVCEAAGITLDRRGHCLNQLSDDKVLIPQYHGGRLRVSFAHDLFRQALHDSLSTEDRCRLHLRLGRALECEFAGELAAHTADLARHFDAAEEHEAAARWLIEHGDHLHALFDYAGAIAEFARAVDHLARFANARALRECWLRIASCHEQELDHDSSRMALEHVFALPLERSRAPSPGLRRDRGEGYMSIATPDAPFGLEPLRFFNAPSFILHRQVYRPLVRYRPRGLIEPDAAARWDTSDDGLSYRFVIREDAMWSDGAPLVAEDYALAFIRAIRAFENSEDGAYIRVKGTPEFRQSGDRSALALRVPHPKVLEFELEAPCPYLLHYLGIPYLQGLPSHLIDRWGDAWTDLDKTAASGPFVIESFDAGTAVHLVRNPRFTGRFSGNVTDLVLTRCSNEEVLDRYEQGTVDAFVVREEKLLGDVMDRCPQDVLAGPGQTVCLLRVNTCSRFLSLRPARQALACAIDQERLVRSCGYQSAAPGTGGLIPPGVRGHRPDVGLPFDPARARALALDGKLRPGTQLSVLAGRWADRLVHNVAHSWRDHLGVEVRFVDEDYEVLNRPPSEWGFDVALLYLMALVPDPLVYLATASSYVNEELRQAFTAARSESDPRQRLQKTIELDASLVLDASRIPLFYPRAHRVARPWLNEAVYFPLFHGGAVDITVPAH